MQQLFSLRNQIRHYDWGSPRWIPELLGEANPAGEPWAELWMGAHPSAPSTVVTAAGERGLDGLVAADPERYLGPASARTFGTLPYLFKLLAAERPLSIQAHPSAEQARAGFDREEAAGVPLDAPDRNYKDRNHKPEIVCALTPFRAMCGFRSPDQAARLIRCVLDRKAPAPMDSDGSRPGRNPDADPYGALRAATTGLSAEGAASYGDLLRALFSLPEESRRGLVEDAAATASERSGMDGEGAAWETVSALATAYPGDPGVLAPLYLNVVDLAPGQALFLPAGVLHAYVRGFAVELMAASDNVLRGGLTTKHIDVDELLSVLSFAPFTPRRLEAQGSPGVYDSPAPEFRLLVLGSGCGAPLELPPGQPIVVVSVEGDCVLECADGERLVLGPGRSAFVAASAPPTRVSGTGRAYAALPRP